MFWLGYCNSMMNPIIYTCASRDFKQAFVRILRCRQQQPFLRHCCCCCRSRRTSSSIVGSPRCVGHRYIPSSTSDITFSDLSSRRRATTIGATASGSLSPPITPSSSIVATFHAADNRCLRVGSTASTTGTTTGGTGNKIYRSTTAAGRSTDAVAGNWRSLATDADVIAVDNDIDDVVGLRLNSMTSSGQSSDIRQSGTRLMTTSASPSVGGCIARWRATSQARHGAFTGQSRYGGTSSAVGVDTATRGNNSLSVLHEERTFRQYRKTMMSFPASFVVGTAASVAE